jgi:hypothetical protein
VGMICNAQGQFPSLPMGHFFFRALFRWSDPLQCHWRVIGHWGSGPQWHWDRIAHGFKCPSLRLQIGLLPLYWTVDNVQTLCMRDGGNGQGASSAVEGMAWQGQWE